VELVRNIELHVDPGEDGDVLYCEPNYEDVAAPERTKKATLMGIHASGTEAAQITITGLLGEDRQVFQRRSSQ
jgi:hypothetical protein